MENLFLCPMMERDGGWEGDDLVEFYRYVLILGGFEAGFSNVFFVIKEGRRCYSEDVRDVELF